MDEAVIADLKQFIATTVSQNMSLHVNELREELTTEIRATKERLTQKIDSISVAVGEALNDSNEATQNQLDNHEKRVKKLEHKTA